MKELHAQPSNTTARHKTPFCTFGTEDNMHEATNPAMARTNETIADISDPKVLSPNGSLFELVSQIRGHGNHCGSKFAPFMWHFLPPNHAARKGAFTNPQLMHRSIESHRPIGKEYRQWGRTNSIIQALKLIFGKLDLIRLRIMTADGKVPLVSPALVHIDHCRALEGWPDNVLENRQAGRALGFLCVRLQDLANLIIVHRHGSFQIAVDGNFQLPPGEVFREDFDITRVIALNPYMQILCDFRRFAEGLAHE